MHAIYVLINDEIGTSTAMLNDINIFLSKDEPLFGNRFFRPDVEDYFISMLGKNASKLRFLKIFLSAKVDEDLHFEERILDCTKTIMSITRYFNFEKYFKSDNYHKKEMLLSMVCNSVCELFTYQQLDLQKIKAIYQTALEQNFVFEWKFRNKLFNVKENYISILYSSDVEYYKIYEALYTHDKKEIVRRCIFMDRIALFKIKELLVDDSNFSYFFIGPTKEFKSSVDNILHGEQILMPVNTSRFFKA